MWLFNFVPRYTLIPPFTTRKLTCPKKILEVSPDSPAFSILQEKGGGWCHGEWTNEIIVVRMWNNNRKTSVWGKHFSYYLAFPEDQRSVRKHLMEKNHKSKKPLKNCKAREWKKFTNHPNYEYYSPKLTPTPTTFNKYSKEPVATSHSWYKEMSQSARIREKKKLWGDC